MVHNLVNFHFFAYLCIHNQAKKRNRKVQFFLCTAAGMERDGRNRERGKRRNFAKRHQLAFAAMQQPLRATDGRSHHLSAQLHPLNLQRNPLRLHRSKYRRHLFSGQQVEYRPHQEGTR